MALIKIKSESMNLADDYAFTGTVSGAGGGKLLQVVSNTKTSVFSTNAGSFVDTGFDVVITPSSTSSKIWVHYDMPVYQAQGDADYYLAIYRNDTTNLHNSSLYHFLRLDAGDQYYSTSLSAYDTPNTTSAVTYSMYAKSGYITQTPAGNSFATVIAMEIDGS
tara:strand:+ start:424 stop:912 length:489 start_codon:yes stop_codon:yes gene_type:complete